MNEPQRITARELREMGFPIPAEVPDCAVVPVGAIRAADVKVKPSPEDVAEGKITANVTFAIDAPFEWVEVDLPVPEGVDPDVFARDLLEAAETAKFAHDLVKHDRCVTSHCPICDGGLAVCRVCGGAEGSLPTHCPGRRMTREEDQDVLHARRDFRAGKWADGSNRP